jgi:UDP-glucose 4-epimerase
MVLPRFVQQALRDEPILVYGDGSQSRCFSYVGDVVRGTLMLAKEPRAYGEVYNIGSDQEISVLALAQRVREIAGSHSEIEFVPFEQIYGERFEDMQRRVPSLRKIHDLVGYRPECSLDELLRLTVSYYRDRHDAERESETRLAEIPTLTGRA